MSVVGCNGSGKDWTAARIVLWWSNVDYPNIHLLRSGEIFFTRAFRELELATNAPTVFSFSGSDTGQWTELTGPAATTSREGGMSVLLLGQCSEPDRVLVVGAPRGESANTVKVIDIPPSGSTWRPYTCPDGKARERANAVLLPDGTVFICGGTNDASDDCYLFDPSRMANNPLIPMDNMTVQRDATHDQALLLPSGKVVTIGHTKKIEVFSPPYLYTAFGFPASQPEITSWPDAYTDQPVLHGHTFEIETPQASDIGGVVIVRPMAVTHQTDTEQRVIPLSFTRSGENTLRVLAPDGRVYPYGSSPTHTHTLAPRGFYMLFVLNNNGVPSAAKFIRLR